MANAEEVGKMSPRMNAEEIAKMSPRMMMKIAEQSPTFEESIITKTANEEIKVHEKD